LDKADALRTKRRQAIAHLDTLTQSIFHSMFGNPALTTDRRELSDLLSSIDSGSSPVSEDRPASPEEWGILKVSAVTTQVYFESENKALTASPPDTRHEVRVGDVLFTRKNTPKLVAAVALVRSTRPKLLLPDLVFRLNIADREILDPEYLQAVLAYPTQRAIIQRLAGGSAASMSNIAKSKLFKVSIPVPSLELQQTFATRVAAVERLKETQRKHLAELDTLFASLQHRAFRGEL
jgi:type I restriction enzyme S subunit